MINIKKERNIAPRPGVGMMVVNKDKKVFVGRRSANITKDDQYWQMPQGGIDPNEEPEEAAKRELVEEIGCDLDHIDVIAVSKNWYTYDIPAMYCSRHFCSQTQKWFLMQFDGEDSDINVSQKKPEFCEWKWVDVKQVPKLVIDFKKDVYKQLVKDFGWFFDQ